MPLIPTFSNVFKNCFCTRQGFIITQFCCRSTLLFNPLSGVFWTKTVIFFHATLVTLQNEFRFRFNSGWKWICYEMKEENKDRQPRHFWRFWQMKARIFSHKTKTFFDRVAMTLSWVKQSKKEFIQALEKSMIYLQEV